MKTSNIDRMLGVFFILTVLTFGALGVAIKFAGTIPATVILLALVGASIKNIPVGYQAQYTWLGERVPVFIEEGWHFVPWPLQLKIIDCRATTVPIDEENIFTIDNVEVKVVKTSLVWKIVDLNLYQNLNPTNLAGLLDDVIDQNVRHKIRKTPWEKVLGMEFSVSEKDIIHDLDQFGIGILKIVVPNIVPVNKEFKEAQELKSKEILQREGQRVQARHHADLIKFFSGTEKLGEQGPKGPGLSEELAYEAALIHMDKAEKKKLASSNFGLDTATAKALVEVVKEIRK